MNSDAKLLHTQFIHIGRYGTAHYYIPAHGERQRIIIRIRPKITINKKDGYRQRNVRQFLQSALGTFWPPLGTPLGVDNHTLAR